jgi:hypothetical protein
LPDKYQFAASLENQIKRFLYAT